MVKSYLNMALKAIGVICIIIFVIKALHIIYYGNSVNNPIIMNTDIDSGISDPSDPGDQDDQLDDVDSLRSLPYLSWSPINPEDKDKKGVVVYNYKECSNGLNLYSSFSQSEACLADMGGNVLHRWYAETDMWETIEIDREGNLFFLVKDQMLGKVDWNSDFLWSVDLHCHNWISIAKNGDIYTIADELRKINEKGKEIPIFDDYIVILTPGGKEKKRISIYDIFGSMIPRGKLEKIYDIMHNPQNPDPQAYRLGPGDPDVFHTNMVKEIERDIPGFCKKGDLLVSIRNLNLIAIVDPAAPALKWKWGEGILDGQHAPVLMKNGNIMIFDNRIAHEDYSRVIELDPIKKKIVFEYTANPPSSFYTREGGGAQKLRNGNILITQMLEGRVFEITPKKEIVWQFYNPVTKVDPNTGHVSRSTIYRMVRLESDLAEAIQEKLKSDNEEANR